MESNAFDLLLLPLLGWFVVIFVAMALVRSMLLSMLHLWSRPIDEDCDSRFKTSHRCE